MNKKSLLVILFLLLLALFLNGCQTIENQLTIAPSQCNRCSNNEPAIRNDAILCARDYDYSCSISQSGTNFCLKCVESVTNGGGSSNDCSDSDGEDYYNKGYVTVKGDAGSPYYDYCSGSNLKEMVCENEGYWVGKAVKLISYYCDNGCRDGKCIENVEELECKDSDGGLVINVKGTVTDKSGKVKTDFCQNSDTVQEYICDDDDLYSAVVRDCPSGKKCFDGACEGVNQCFDLDTGELRDVGYKYCRWNYPQTEYSYECMSNGEWKNQLCIADCDDNTGECFVGECHAGLYANERCKDSDTKIYDKCGEDRYWVTNIEEDCPSGKVCEDGQCKVGNGGGNEFNPIGIIIILIGGIVGFFVVPKKERKQKGMVGAMIGGIIGVFIMILLNAGGVTGSQKNQIECTVSVSNPFGTMKIDSASCQIKDSCLFSATQLGIISDRGILELAMGNGVGKVDVNVPEFSSRDYLVSVCSNTKVGNLYLKDENGGIIDSKRLEIK